MSVLRSTTLAFAESFRLDLPLPLGEGWVRGLSEYNGKDSFTPKA